MLFVNIYRSILYVYKTVAYIHTVLYHGSRHLRDLSRNRQNDHICEIGRFSYVSGKIRIETGGEWK